MKQRLESYILQEKQLQVGMGITKLRQKVKEQQERVGQKVWKQNFLLWISGELCSDVRFNLAL